MCRVISVSIKETKCSFQVLNDWVFPFRSSELSENGMNRIAIFTERKFLYKDRLMIQKLTDWKH